MGSLWPPKPVARDHRELRVLAEARIGLRERALPEDRSLRGLDALGVRAAAAEAGVDRGHASGQ